MALEQLTDDDMQAFGQNAQADARVQQIKAKINTGLALSVVAVGVWTGTELGAGGNVAMVEQASGEVRVTLTGDAAALGLLEVAPLVTAVAGAASDFRPVVTVVQAGVYDVRVRDSAGVVSESGFTIAFVRIATPST